METAANKIVGFVILLFSSTLMAAPNLNYAQNLLKSKQTLEQHLKASELGSNHIYQILEAEMALNRNMPQVALKNYIAVAKETQDPNVAERATQIALNLATLEEAVEPAKIWAAAAPDKLESQITLAAIYIRLGQNNLAIPYLKQVIKLDPIDSDRHFVMIHKQLPGDNDQANVIDTLNKLAQQSQNHNAAQLALADIALFENRANDALVFSKQALDINPKDPKASILYGQALLQNQRVQEANQFLEKKLEQLPDSLALKQYYIQFLLAQNLIDKAQVHMHSLSKRQDLDPTVKLQLARLSMQAGWLDEAESFLQQIRQEAEFASTANYFLARVYESKSDPNEAVNWYEKVTDGSFHIIAYTRASTLLSQMKQYGAAIALLERAEPQHYADLKRLMLAQLDIRVQSGDIQSAYDVASHLLQRDPEDIDYLYSRALLAERLNKLDTAEQDLKGILSLDPSHIDALNALGFILADHTQRFDEAMTYIKKALQLSPSNPSILDSLGWLQYKMGETEQSITTLRKALSIYPDPEIAAHLGEVLWSSNQQTEATKVWNDALQNSPNDEKLLQTMKRLVGDNGKH